MQLPEESLAMFTYIKQGKWLGKLSRVSNKSHSPSKKTRDLLGETILTFITITVYNATFPGPAAP
jgi:hypothetical protein